jgi:hypothetical protein
MQLHASRHRNCGSNSTVVIYSFILGLLPLELLPTLVFLVGVLRFSLEVVPIGGSSTVCAPSLQPPKKHSRAIRNRRASAHLSHNEMTTIRPQQIDPRLKQRTALQPYLLHCSAPKVEEEGLRFFTRSMVYIIKSGQTQ